MSKHFLLCRVLWCNSGTIDSLILLHLPSFLKIYVEDLFLFYPMYYIFLQLPLLEQFMPFLTG